MDGTLATIKFSPPICERGPVQIFLGQARGAGGFRGGGSGWTVARASFPRGVRRADGRAVARGAVDRVGRASTRDPRAATSPSSDGCAPGRATVQREDPGDRRRTRARSRGAPPRRAVGWPSIGAHVGVGVRTSSLRRFALLLRVLRSGDVREGNLAYLRPPGLVSQVTRQPRITVCESSFPTRCPRSRVTARSRAHSRARERVTTAVVAHPTPSSH